MSQQARRRKARPKARPKAGPAGGLGNLPGKRKEEPHMILRTSVAEGPANRYRTMKDFKIYRNQIDGTKINISNKSVGGSVTVKTKLGRNKPTKMY